ncbi:glycosyltransferase [uncultured Treponema sp.]|uniref:glycosyltransferase n=1 Tax=uncultured Treponema sp. TaxID=162155 RepID=UPI0025F6D394|nr:glycosyltransferase [uncultured Treponema sp.]
MTYVYVLVSGKNDLYYEQALMSTYSLRNLMPDANIILLVDDKTENSINSPSLQRDEIKKYVSKIISVEFDEKVSNTERSRLIKTSIPEYVDDDFLYIDCDTIIAEELSEIEKIPYKTAGILDGHVMLYEHIHKKYFLERDKKLGFHGTKAAGCNINGGVIFARKSEESKNLFKAWNEAWKYSAYQKHDFHDQSALNEANYRTGLKMQLIDGKWNCQPSHGGLAFLKDAKIIHYYSSEFSGKNYIPYYKLADKELQNRIKVEGKIPEDIKNMIDDPKFQFNKVHLINDQRIVSIMQSPIVFTLADIKSKLPWLFNVLESICRASRNFAKKLKKKK